MRPLDMATAAVSLDLTEIYAYQLYIVVIVVAIIAFFVRRFLQATSVNCSLTGASSLFTATFDDDAVGSAPSPTAPLLYGPPGASLNISGEADTVEIVDSAALGSKALKMTRAAPDMTQVEAVVGDMGEAPYTSGVAIVEFRAHGEALSEPFIAGVGIYVSSSGGPLALALRLYEDAYYYREGESNVRIDGSYDPGVEHFVHIEVNLDTRKYSICIDGEAVVAEKDFIGDGFADLHALKFLIAPTVTESFPTAYVVDDIRITR